MLLWLEMKAIKLYIVIHDVGPKKHCKTVFNKYFSSRSSHFHSISVWKTLLCSGVLNGCTAFLIRWCCGGRSTPILSHKRSESGLHLPGGNLDRSHHFLHSSHCDLPAWQVHCVSRRIGQAFWHRANLTSWS